MMQPEDKIQEIAERAERLQEIGSSILRVARDELYLGGAAEDQGVYPEAWTGAFRGGIPAPFRGCVDP